MIYVAKLAAPVKKAYGERCYGTNVQKIIEQLSLDPKVSGMDACVLSPKDVVGIMRAKVQKAIDNKHPDTCVIYLYQTDKEADLINTPFKKQLKKVNPDTVQEAVDEFMGEYLVSAKKTVVSRDLKVDKQIKSKPTETPVMAGGLKGNLVKKKAAAAKSGEENKDRTEDDLKLDPALNLWYYIDALGNMVYVDKKTRKPLSKFQIQAQKERIEKGLVKLPTTPKKQTGDPDTDATDEDFTDDDDDDGLVVNMGEDPSSTTKSPLETAYPYTGTAKPTGTHAEPPVQAAQPLSTDERTARDFERNIQSISNFHDWNLFKEALSKDATVRALLEENATYQGVVQMLSVLDADIKAAYYDRGLTAEQKFEKVLEIGNKRSVLMATHNDILARKVLDIIDAVTISARRTVEELLTEHRKSMEQLIVSKDGILDETQLSTLMTNRANAEFELLALIKGIIKLYQAMDLEINDVILSLDAKLPSDNEFINNMVGSAADILTPTNTKELATQMMRALQEKREVFALLQDKVYSVIDAIHDLLQRDQDIIEYQNYKIKMLKAHRVEDAVIVDSVLKNILHVYIGPRDNGTTATTLTWSGCLSRRRNTLLIDLSNESKLADYGVEPVDLDEFLRVRIDRPLCVVSGHITDPEALAEFVKELKTRLDYYAYINILLDDSQANIADSLAGEAFTVNHITNCTRESLTTMCEVYNSITARNVARKLLLVDPPMDVLKIAEKIGVDVTVTKCISIPNVPRIKTCGLSGDQPYEYPEVRAIFEEAFK